MSSPTSFICALISTNGMKGCCILKNWNEGLLYFEKNGMKGCYKLKKWNEVLLYFVKMK